MAYPRLQVGIGCGKLFKIPTLTHKQGGFTREQTVLTNMTVEKDFLSNAN